MNYDFLVVGAGLYGSVFARLMADKGYSCIIIDKRKHIAGNIYTERIGDIDVHKYGPHIFHTDNFDVIKFIQKYAIWQQFTLNILAYDGETYFNLPFNRSTYIQVYNKATVEQVCQMVKSDIYEANVKYADRTDLEATAMKMAGQRIYEKLIKNYTEKQWGQPCNQLPGSIIKRLPMRWNFDNNYFNDIFQAIPVEGYTQFIKNIIGDDISVQLNTPFDYNEWKDKAKHIIYCGAVDELCGYQLGELGWRSLMFEESSYQFNGYNGQGNAIINNVQRKEYAAWTRTIEHQWFKPVDVYKWIDDCEGQTRQSIITKEYPVKWNKSRKRYYPVNNDENNSLYNQYVEYLKEIMPNVMLGGRLGKYKYFDMDDTIIEAMKDVELFENKRRT